MEAAEVLMNNIMVQLLNTHVNLGMLWMEVLQVNVKRMDIGHHHPPVMVGIHLCIKKFDYGKFLTGCILFGYSNFLWNAPRGELCCHV